MHMYMYISLTVLVLSLQTGFGNADDFSETIEALNRFSYNFYKELSVKIEQGFIASPYSAAVVLCMLSVATYMYTGNHSLTSLEINLSLGFRSATINNIDPFEDILLSQNSFRKDYILNVNDSIWVQFGTELNLAFELIMGDAFFAERKNVDFDNEITIPAINDWIRKKTKNKVPKTLFHTAPETVITLANAIYFNAPWENPFDKSLTENITFHDPISGKDKIVAMMNREGEYLVSSIDSLKARLIELPFIRKRHSMIIISPQGMDGLPEIEKGINPEIVEDALKKSSRKKMQLALPRFQTKGLPNLSYALQTMGIKEAYTSSAELSGISKNVSLTDVIQSAVLDINEEGTVVAAGSVVAVGRKTVPPQPAEKFNLDHPFLFIIRHVETGLILFMGRYDVLNL